LLSDIAVLTGGTAITANLGIELESLTLHGPRPSKKVVVNKYNTTIVEGASKATELVERVKQIRAQIDETLSDSDREMLQQRLATLVGGIAVIRVATATEERRKQKKARVENAIRVAKAAAEEGIVPGGGVAYIRAQEALQSFSLESDDENMGISIVSKGSRRALVRSLRTRGRVYCDHPQCQGRQ